MLQDRLLIVLFLLFSVSMLSIISNRIRISYPILLVIAGLFIGIVPSLPFISLQPDIVFLIFLPPLLFNAAWNTAWKDFWAVKRSITMLAFGLVFFTSFAVAVLSHAIIPDFTLAMGFLLGGIISPPDAVAATSVLQNLKVPKRVVTLLEGESLVNDAASLIVFRFALAAILTGRFNFWQASGDFFVVATMGIVVGLLIGIIIYCAYRYLPTTSSIDTVISFLTPYLLYIAAEHFKFSGVLSVVSGGLFLSYHAHKIFTYNSRLQAGAFWETLIFLLNGVVFILIGLQLPGIVKGLGQYSIGDAVFYAVIISAVTIIIRIVWVFPGAYFPRWVSKKIRDREPRPGLKSVFLVGWSGMRGVVSLASALAVPITLSGDTPFPHRNLILFITFITILFTLVLQGLTLPVIIKKLKIDDPGENIQEQEKAIRLRLAGAALDFMQERYSEEVASIDAYSRLKERYERMIAFANTKLLKEEDESSSGSFLSKYRQMLVEIVSVRREELHKLRQENQYGEELLRSKERELDLEEARLKR